jgi:hypothetical protein
MDWITANAHHLLLALLLFIGIGVCVAVIIFIRHGRDPLACLPRDDEKPDWLIGTAFVALILAGNAWLDMRDLRNIDAAVMEQRRIQAGYLPSDRASLQIDINRSCGPRTEGMTDQLVMTIATRSDLHHTVTGCSRISHRQFMPKQREQVRG